MSYPAYFLKEANADLRERIKNGGEELHDLILSMSDSEIEEFKQKAYEKYAQKPEFKIYLDASENKNKDIVDFQQLSEAETQKEFDRLMNEDLPDEQGYFSKVTDDLSNIGKAWDAGNFYSHGGWNDIGSNILEGGNPEDREKLYQHYLNWKSQNKMPENKTLVGDVVSGVANLVPLATDMLAQSAKVALGTGLFGAGVSSVVPGMGTLSGFLTGATLGGKASMVTQSYKIGMADIYTTLREAGIDDATAVDKAKKYGVAYGALEYFGKVLAPVQRKLFAGKILKEIVDSTVDKTVKNNLLRKFAKYGVDVAVTGTLESGIEGGQAGLTEAALQDANGKGFDGSKIAEAILNEAKTVAPAMFGMAGLGSGIERIGGRKSNNDTLHSIPDTPHKAGFYKDKKGNVVVSGDVTTPAVVPNAPVQTPSLANKNTSEKITYFDRDSNGNIIVPRLNVGSIDVIKDKQEFDRQNGRVDSDNNFIIPQDLTAEDLVAEELELYEVANLGTRSFSYGDKIYKIETGSDSNTYSLVEINPKTREIYRESFKLSDSEDKTVTNIFAVESREKAKALIDFAERRSVFFNEKDFPQKSFKKTLDRFNWENFTDLDNLPFSNTLSSKWHSFEDGIKGLFKSTNKETLLSSNLPIVQIDKSILEDFSLNTKGKNKQKRLKELRGAIRTFLHSFVGRDVDVRFENGTKKVYFTGVSLREVQSRVNKPISATVAKSIFNIYEAGQLLSEDNSFYHFISAVKIENTIYPIRWTVRKPLAENGKNIFYDFGIWNENKREFVDSQNLDVVLLEHDKLSNYGLNIGDLFFGSQAFKSKDFSKSQVENTNNELDLSDSEVEAMLENFADASKKPSREEIAESKRQYKEVVAKYKDTPLWMKAPNGKDTKLTAKQWVWVRTPNFKKWFGDWETLAIINEVENMPAMQLISPTKAYSDNKEIKELFKTFGVVENKKNGNKTRFAGSTVGKIVGHKNIVPLSEVLDSFKSLFETSILAIEEKEVLKEGHKQHSNFVGYEHYINKFTYQNNVYYIRFTVAVENVKPHTLRNGYIPRNVHSSMITNVSIYSESPQSKSDLSTSGTKGAFLIDDKLSKFLSSVKQKDVSKVVDDNGEPLVVYHGTDSNFNVFEANNASTDYDFPSGMYFSSSRNIAKTYTSSNPNIVMSLYLTIKNPLVLDANGRNYNDFYDELYSAVKGIDKDVYDGIIIHNVRDDWSQRAGGGEVATTYVAFKPNQIKSATSNLGTFDSDNPDIEYSFGRKLENKSGLKMVESIITPKGMPTDINSPTIIEDMKEWAIDFYDGKTVKMPNENGELKEVSIDKRGIKEAMNRLRKRVSSDKKIAFIKTMPLIVEFLKNARFKSKPSNKHKGQKLDVYKYEVGYIDKENANKKYIVDITVKENLNGRFYYDHNLTNIKTLGVPRNSDVKTSTTSVYTSASENYPESQAEYSFGRKNVDLTSHTDAPDVDVANGDYQYRPWAKDTKTASGKLSPRKINPNARLPETNVSMGDIRRYLSQALDIPIKSEFPKSAKRAGGLYYPDRELIRLKDDYWNNLSVFGHELFHYLHRMIFGGDNFHHKNVDQFDYAPAIQRELKHIVKTHFDKDAYASNLHMKEGFAEFGAIWLADPVVARAHYPNITIYFEERLSMFPDVEKVLYRARKAIDKVTKYSDREKLLSMIKSSDDVLDKKGFEGLSRDELYTRFVDDLYPLELAEKRLKELGADPKDLNALKLAVNYRGGNAGKAMVALEKGIFDEDGKVQCKGYSEICEEVGKKNLKDFEAYLVIQHAKELYKRGIKTGVEKFFHVYDDDPRLPIFKQAADDLYIFQRKVLWKLVQGGCISKLEYEKIVKLNLFYVPFKRIVEESIISANARSKSFVNVGKGLAKIKGSTREIVSPLETIVKNTLYIYDYAERNKIARAFVGVSEKVQGGARIANPFFRKYKPLTVSKEDKRKIILQSGIVQELLTMLNADKSIDPNKFISEKLNELDYIYNIFYEVPATDAAKGVFRVMKDGKPYYYQCDDQFLYEALTSCSERQLKAMDNCWLRLLQIPAKTVRDGAIRGLGFGLKNFVKDINMARITSGYGTFEFLGALFPALRHSFLGVRSDVYNHWRSSGGQYANNRDIDDNTIIRSVLKSNPGWTQRIITHPIETVVEFYESFLQLLAYFPERLEEVPRLAKFYLDVKHGISSVEAANNSKDVTLNFSRGGRDVKFLNKFAPFTNAKVQGFDKMFRTFNPKSGNRHKAFRAFVSGINGFTLMTIALWWLQKDDEEIRNLPTFIKMSNIPIRFGKDIVFIPVHEMVACFTTYPWALLDAVYERDSTYVTNILKEYFDKDEIFKSLVSILPTGIKLIGEFSMNKDTFTGRDIESYYMQNLLPEDRWNSRTSATAIALGRAMEISPVKIDHAVKGVFSTLGKQGVQYVIDPMVKYLSDFRYPEPSRHGWQTYPIVSRFVDSRNTKNVFYQEHCKDLKELEMYVKSRNKARKERRENDFLARHKEKSIWARKLNSILNSSPREKIDEYDDFSYRAIWNNHCRSIQKIDRSMNLSSSQKQEKIIPIVRKLNEIATEIHKLKVEAGLK